MIRRHMFMGAAAATFALASCSGDDVDDPSPTPTPTTSPTPTPTASPTYAALPLTAALEFNTIVASGSYTGDPAGAVTLGLSSTEALNTRFRLATSNAIATATYVVREGTEESRFVNANVTTAPAPSTTEYVFRTTDTATAGKFSQVEFLNNTIPSQVTTNTALNLTAVSYVNWWRGDSTAGAKRFTSGVFGYNTAFGDLPATGTQAYTSTVSGRWVSVTGAITTVARITGTVTTSVNYATGQVDMTLTIAQGGGAPITLTAQGALPVGQVLFSGSFLSGSPLSGTFNGGFYGSQGKEVGVAFQASGTIGATQHRIVGVVVGKK